MAALLVAFALARALGRMLPQEERMVGWLAAVGVVLVAVLLPVTLRGQVPRGEAGGRKALQVLTAGLATVVPAFLGVGVVLSAALGAVAAVVFALAWPGGPAEEGRG